MSNMELAGPLGSDIGFNFDTDVAFERRTMLRVLGCAVVGGLVGITVARCGEDKTDPNLGQSDKYGEKGDKVPPY